SAAGPQSFASQRRAAEQPGELVRRHRTGEKVTPFFSVAPASASRLASCHLMSARLSAPNAPAATDNTAPRADGRRPDQLRPIRFQNHIAPYASGSTLIEWGNTRVICGVTVEETVPRWMKEQNVAGGWITAEYSMLPYSTPQRKQRDISKGKIDGRSQEIQRLIGRAMRAAVNLEKLGPRTLWVDCDVLQADGGTRTAAITGSYVALCLAVGRLLADQQLHENVLLKAVAAVSVGIVNQQVSLDLCYVEDAAAQEAIAALLESIFAEPASVYTDAQTQRTAVSIYWPKRSCPEAEIRVRLRRGLRQIRERGRGIYAGRVAIRKIRRQDWAESWKKHFKPLEFGQALLRSEE